MGIISINQTTQITQTGLNGQSALTCPYTTQNAQAAQNAQTVVMAIILIACSMIITWRNMSSVI